MKKTIFALLIITNITSLLGIDLVSPNNRIKLQFSLENMLKHKNCPVYNVEYDDKQVIKSSRLGLLVEDCLLSKDFSIVSYSSHLYDETWKPVYGERSEVRNNYRQLTVKLKSKSYPDYRFIIDFRCFNEGVAFCYTIKNIANKNKKVNIKDDLSEFSFLANHTAWATRNPQGAHQKIVLSRIKHDVERPLVVKISDKIYTAIAEARVVDFCQMRLINNRQNTIKCNLYDNQSTVSLPYTTPWRLLMIGDSPCKLVNNNDIILNLNPPCAIEDTSWIKPGKIIREVTLTTVGAKACIDFSKKHNLQYIEFDAGWYGHEYTTKSDASTVTVDPKRSPGPLDMPEIIRYAKEHDIGVIIYVNRIAMLKQLDQILPLYEKWGIAGVKYGFVHVGSQHWTLWLHDAIRKAAEHHLMVDIHDNYRPTGFSRTYPNLMTQEGVRGDEEKQSAVCCLNTLFTRTLAGAADNTVCYYNERVDKYWSHAFQLAKSVCFYSPWQFLYWYDLPQASRPKGGNMKGVIKEDKELEFFDEVPTVWDDSKVLQGNIGEYIVTARRSKEKWFVGVLNASKPQTISILLDFLDDNKKYQAYIYSDDSSLKTFTKVKISEIIVDSKTVIKREILANNGLAIRLIPTTINNKGK